MKVRKTKIRIYTHNQNSLLFLADSDTFLLSSHSHLNELLLCYFILSRNYSFFLEIIILLNGFFCIVFFLLVQEQTMKPARKDCRNLEFENKQERTKFLFNVSSLRGISSRLWCNKKDFNGLDKYKSLFRYGLKYHGPGCIKKNLPKPKVKLCRSLKMLGTVLGSSQMREAAKVDPEFIFESGVKVKYISLEKTFKQMQHVHKMKTFLKEHKYYSLEKCVSKKNLLCVSRKRRNFR